MPIDMALFRVLPVAPASMDDVDVERINQFFGNDRWQAIYEDRVKNLIDASTARRRYLNLYEGNLHKEGFEYVIHRPIYGGRGRSRPLYYLVFASYKDVGMRIMDHIFKYEYGAQTTFLRDLDKPKS